MKLEHRATREKTWQFSAIRDIPYHVLSGLREIDMIALNLVGCPIVGVHSACWPGAGLWWAPPSVVCVGQVYLSAFLWELTVLLG